MKKVNARKIFAAIVLAGVASASWSADKEDIGKREYDNNCVACHGADGKGGIYVDFLKTTPPDLTQLTKANGGVFPLERVYGAIDGRQQVKSHGTREMPIWGRDYQIRAGEHYYGDVIYDSDAFVRGRILALVDYLNRLQAR
jgi:mono/diheme cytochrome c family protein